MLTSTRCLLLATLPYAMAEFDKCARASGVWAGVDQVRVLTAAALRSLARLYAPHRD